MLTPNNFYEADKDVIKYLRKYDENPVECMFDIMNVAMSMEELKTVILQLKW